MGGVLVGLSQNLRNNSYLFTATAVLKFRTNYMEAKQTYTMMCCVRKGVVRGEVCALSDVEVKEGNPPQLNIG